MTPTPFVSPVTLTGHYVTLVPLSLEHVPALFEAMDADREVWRAHVNFYPETLAEMQTDTRATLDQVSQGQRVAFAVIHNETQRVIGSTSYGNISAENRHLEIGWTWYLHELWRTAVNTQCKYLLLRHAFETVGCIRVQLRTDERNARSRAAIERLGCKYEGTLREERILPDGFHRSTVLYSMLAHEWPARKVWLEERLAVPA